jgi:glycosyltransferase involved in cell wall biosynthesis
MTDTRKLSICLTNYNREDMLHEAIAQVIDDARIDDIVISDDCSEYNLYARIKQYYKDVPKVRCSMTDTNVGCYRNKRRAISLALNEFVVIFDSDNILGKDYIDIIYKMEFWEEKVVFAPSFARPHFNYTSFSGDIINRSNVSGMVDRKHFTAMINTMNYFVNRDEYLRVWDKDMKEPWTADTAYQNYRWLEAGNSIHVLAGLQYEHRVHDGSHYQEHNRKTGKLFDQVMDKMRALR